ncbi:MAG: MliC family protein [Rhodospirillales bacterium]|nr:MliC family protein [Rhodospirillales bacterium]
MAGSLIAHPRNGPSAVRAGHAPDLRALLLLLALGACAPLAPGAVVYDCADGSTLTAAYDAGTDRLDVLRAGEGHMLTHLPAASGARYGAGGMELWSKGPEAVLIEGPGRPPLRCRAR